MYMCNFSNYCKYMGSTHRAQSASVVARVLEATPETQR